MKLEHYAELFCEIARTSRKTKHVRLDLLLKTWWYSRVTVNDQPPHTVGPREREMTGYYVPWHEYNNEDDDGYWDQEVVETKRQQHWRNLEIQPHGHRIADFALFTRYRGKWLEDGYLVIHFEDGKPTHAFDEGEEWTIDADALTFAPYSRGEAA